jgi:adenine-specific DNA-methyltransferase
VAFLMSAPACNVAPVENEQEHGEVFTRRWVVDLMLSAVGYTPNRDLSQVRLVEPAAGSGAFVIPALERLSESLKTHGKPLDAASFRAFELQEKNLPELAAAMQRVLAADGWGKPAIRKFVENSVTIGDYLFAGHEPKSVDLVIGNPPYIRSDDLGEERFEAYKAVSPAMTGRADIYIAFFDLALDSLADEGICTYICADRWLRNAYGKKLRAKTLNGFSFDLVLTMHDAPAFETSVSAYPAITIIRRGKQGPAVLANGDATFEEAGATKLVSWLRGGKKPLAADGVTADRIPDWFNTDESWPDASPARIKWLEHLEETLPTIEESGVELGIGIATGLDAVYVVKGDAIPDIEPARLLPLIVADDIRSTEFRPTGTMLVNPWDEYGKVVDLEDFPLFTTYMETYGAKLKDRHTAKKNPNDWVRTIDKVKPGLTERPKLLFQDMKARIEPVLHDGGLYPHHNLYYAVSGIWDMRVLGGLMLSDVVEVQVHAYCVKMRGETMRFQIQYLKRVRLPRFEDIDVKTRKALAIAFDKRDRVAATNAALTAFGLTELPE